MIKQIYIIRNNVACINYPELFMFNTDAQACQNFVHFVKSATEKTGEKDIHFDLYRLGILHPDNILEGHDEPIRVARGIREAEACVAAAETDLEVKE